MYYLFLKNKLAKYKQEFDRVQKSIEQGKTPVFNEIRQAKTMLAECFPYNILNGCFVIIGTLLLNKVHASETLNVAIVLVISSFCNSISNYIFTNVKHYLRLQLCKRLGVPQSEASIAVMESLEYQSV